jgi:hypothetical protein
MERLYYQIIIDFVSSPLLREEKSVGHLRPRYWEEQLDLRGIK